MNSDKIYIYRLLPDEDYDDFRLANFQIIQFDDILPN
jgi:hypothetical protein